MQKEWFAPELYSWERKLEQEDALLLPHEDEYMESILITCYSLMNPELWQRRNRLRTPKGYKTACSLSFPVASTPQYIFWCWRPINSLPRKKTKLQRYGGRKALRSNLKSKPCYATCHYSLPVWFFYLMILTGWHKNLSRTQLKVQSFYILCAMSCFQNCLFVLSKAKISVFHSWS